MKIVTIGIKYPQKRLILNKIQGIDYISYPNYVNPFLKKINTYEIYKPIFDQNIDAYHTINTILLTKKPWICSFETMLPRGRQFLHIQHHNSFDLQIGWYQKYLLSTLSKDNCKKLIAFSKCNYNLQKQVYQFYPHLYDSLINKTCILKAPQECLIEKPKDVLNEKIRFVFVGNDFIRKGAKEIIEAFCELRKMRDDFEVVLITNVNQTYNYAFRNFQDSPVEINSTIDKMKKSKNWLKIYTNLPNLQVLEILKVCDIGLLPTWSDTYGYSCLEMQACGLPVISTNIRALPEINSNGWFINLPINYAGELGLINTQHKNQIRTLMIEQLINLANTALDNRISILTKGSLSYNYIKELHSPLLYSENLNEIYQLFSE